MSRAALKPKLPRPVRPGDLVGVCAPAGPVEADRMRAGVAELEGLGFRVRVPEGLFARTGFTAGGAERRLVELHGLFSDDEVAGIFCGRGGAGCGGLLPRLDAGLIAAHPKVFVGYSDITFIHLFLARLGLVSFHGPMVARELGQRSYHRESLVHALSGKGDPYSATAGELVALRPGVAEGRLRGGCLSILAASVGTPWAPVADEEGTLLLLEDVDEPPYRVERLLLQLRQAEALAGVKGIVFGEMKGCGPDTGAGYTLEQVILGALEGLELPIALGLSSGHTRGPNVTVPLGVRGRLESGETARFCVLEPGVS